MTSLLVVAALDEEVAYVREAEVLVTGVGKAVAAARLAHRLGAGPLPDVVINVGTAGALDPALTGVVEVSYVTQHDFPYAEIETLTGPLPRGYVLASDRPPVTASSPPPGAVIVASADAFVADAGRAAAIAATGVQLVDMEAFAYAATCEAYGVPLRCVKAVSDSADADAGLSFLDTIDHCAQALAAWLELRR